MTLCNRAGIKCVHSKHHGVIDWLTENNIYFLQTDNKIYLHGNENSNYFNRQFEGGENPGSLAWVGHAMYNTNNKLL